MSHAQQQLRALPDDELLRRLRETLVRSRRIESDLVAHIGEVDRRRLYAREAAPSMFAYCTEVLHLSEHAAYLRIAVARASREHPELLAMLADGRLHLTAIAKLASHLTAANRGEVLARATHRSKRAVEELIAELAPRPDIAPVMRKVPRAFGTRQTFEARQTLGSQPTNVCPVPPTSSPAPPLVAPTPSSCTSSQLGPDRVESRPLSLALSPPRPSIEPLAPTRYKVQFRASAALHEKLERLQAPCPGADLAELIEQAISEKLERLEARRFGRVAKPRKTLAECDPRPSSRHIPAPVRRAVYERDGSRCTFTDPRGRRCKARRDLEFHHHGRPYGRGGDHTVANLRLMCPTHNALLAEREYGSAAMARYRRSPGRVSEAAAPKAGS